MPIRGPRSWHKAGGQGILLAVGQTDRVRGGAEWTRRGAVIQNCRFLKETRTEGGACTG